MIRKAITFTNFNDEEVTEIHHFHLSRPEVIELEASLDGGLSATLKSIIGEVHNRKLIEYFKLIILASYGIKSDDGRHFRKSQEIARDFEQSAAYDSLYMELLSDANVAAAFIEGVLPRLEDQDKPLLPPPSPNWTTPPAKTQGA